MKSAYFNLKKYKRAYCLLASGQSYIDLAKYLIESLNLYSNYPIILYYSDGEVNYDFDNLIIQPYYSKKPSFEINDDRIFNKFKTLEIPSFILSCLDCYDVNTLVKLDIDMLATPNIDKIFDYENEIENYPVFIKYSWDHTIMLGSNMENLHVSELLNNPIRSMFDVCGCTLILNQNCKQYLKDWNILCNNEFLIQYYFNTNKNEYFKYDDEHIANILLWKYKANKYLPPNFVWCNQEKVLNFVFEQYSKNEIDLPFHECLHNSHYKIPIEFDNAHGFSTFPINKIDLWGVHCIKTIEKMKLLSGILEKNYEEINTNSK